MKDPFMTPEQQRELNDLYRVVDAFTSRMKQKLREKLLEGFSGWDQASLEEDIDFSLYRHVRKTDGEEIDIANLAMMLWNIRRMKLKSRIGEKA